MSKIAFKKYVAYSTGFVIFCL